MLGLGVGEVIIILVVALVVLGPTKLPQVARQVGKGLREFRRHASDLQHTFDEVAREAEREERERERKAAIGMAPPEHLPVAANEPLPQADGSPVAPETTTPAPEPGAAVTSEPKP
ncbi:MAG: Sec-independent protein translocase protein TatB [Myxococcota bacterium]